MEQAQQEAVEGQATDIADNLIKGDNLKRKPPRPANDEERNQYLKEVFTAQDSNAKYGSAQTVFKTVKKEGKYSISFSEIEDFLSSQPAYSLYKRSIKRFDRPRVVVSEKDGQWDVDTLSMRWYSKWNKDYGYILVCVDILTRFLIARPLVALRAEYVKEAFEDIFKVTSTPPRSIRSDNGTEIKNSLMKQYFRSQGIVHFFSINTVKASFCERVIQTLRVRLGRAMRGQNNFNWVNHLQEVVDSYNNTYHKSLKCTPMEAMCVKDRAALWNHQYLRNDSATKTGPNKPYKFNIGDRVRISYIKNPFSRAYDETFGREIHTIVGRRMDQGYQKYSLKTQDNILIDGEFFHEQMTKANVTEDTVYEIEEILERKKMGRGRNKKWYVKCKWLGYPARYNSYVLESDVTDL